MSKKDYQQVRRNRRTAREEKKAIKDFNNELQKAIDRVDWSKVKLPRQHC